MSQKWGWVEKGVFFGDFFGTGDFRQKSEKRVKKLKTFLKTAKSTFLAFFALFYTYS